MNPHPLFTPIYLLDNHHAAHALCVFTGVPNSVEHKQPQQRHTQLTNQLINNHGYGEILRQYSIQNTLDIKFIKHFKTWYSFDLITLLRPENKEKVFDLITRLNDDPKMAFDHARYLVGLYSPTEMQSLPDLKPPEYKKLKIPKTKTQLATQAKSEALHLKLNPPHMDDLIPDHLYKSHIPTSKE